MFGLGITLFGIGRYRELSHLPALLRDQIVDRARSRLIRRNRWGLLACGIVNFGLTVLLFSDITVGTSDVMLRLALLLLLGLSMNAITIFLQTRGLRRMIADELLIRRIRPSHCLICGYDLRESGRRCPECGAEVAEKIAN